MRLRAIPSKMPCLLRHVNPSNTFEHGTQGCRHKPDERRIAIIRSASANCQKCVPRSGLKIPLKAQAPHSPGLTTHTNSRIGAGFDMLFFASEDKVLPSNATSPIGLLPCTVL